MARCRSAGVRKSVALGFHRPAGVTAARQRLKDHMSRPVPVRRLQRVAHLTLSGERQPPGGDRRPGDVATQPLDLLALIGPGGDAGVEGKAVGLCQERSIRCWQQRARQAP